jgi:dipeptidyl aminopeptidase/acylaminoacyl peptidase
MKHVTFYSLLILLFMFSGLTSAAQKSKTNDIVIDQWIMAGPLPVSMPAFHNKHNLSGKTFQAADLLKFQYKKIEHPGQGDLFMQTDKEAIRWKQSNGNHKINCKELFVYALNWQLTYLQAHQFLPINIEVTSAQAFELFIDGKRKLSQYNPSAKANTKHLQIKLEPGKYALLIKSLYKSSDSLPWKVTASVSYDADFPENALTISTSNEQFMDIAHLLHGQQLKSSSLSDDGRWVMLHFAETYPPKGKTDRWFEIRETSTGKIVFSSRHSNIHSAQWVPGEASISYLAKNGDQTNLVLFNLNSRNEITLLVNPQRFAGYQWSPTGKFLIYSIREKQEKNKSGVFKLEGMPDRWPWYRMRTQLYLLNRNNQSSKPLTYGYLTNQLQDISPDGSRILFSQSFPNYSQRPFTRQILMEMNLKTLQVDTIWNTNYGGSVSYSPDGRQLLVTGSPSMFQGAGVHLKKAKIPNNYDIQAYIYDLKTKSAKAISKNFNPSISDTYWNPLDKLIYILAEDRTYKDIWTYNPKNEVFTRLNTRMDMVNQMDFARKSNRMVYSGTSISSPAVAWLYDLDAGKQKLVANPEKDFFANVKFGRTEDWNFKNKKGVTIEGRVYYPPDYDASKKYPLIVYYYGGTSPTGRDFRGRYPKNLFAAMGYIVYDLQPSGATGYGQDFSALHVNGWGKENARDIIEGTQKFLKAHPQVDSKAVGCLGASYGGYMTMYLQTQTDLFATAIAHAGISSITSYWGQGYWGYLYSSVASANSYPWNNKKLYVDHSPIYLADKIHTPLLLLHGTADTNVPTGESIQLYTALKLLGRDVELVEVEGQDHHIMEYKKRILWQKTIFAWFDKYLKHQPQWWEAMYPKKDL